MTLLEKNWKNVFTISLAYFNVDLSMLNEKEVVKLLDQRGLKLDEKIKHLENFQAFRESVGLLAACGLDEFEFNLLKLISLCRTGNLSKWTIFTFKKGIIFNFGFLFLDQSMTVENDYAIKLIQSNAIFGLNEHESKKSKFQSSSFCSFGGPSGPANLLLTTKTKLLVESLVEMNKKVSEATLEIVFFSNSIRNFSIRQFLVEIFSRKWRKRFKIEIHE